MMITYDGMMMILVAVLQVTVVLSEQNSFRE